MLRLGLAVAEIAETKGVAVAVAADEEEEEEEEEEAAAEEAPVDSVVVVVVVVVARQLPDAGQVTGARNSAGALSGRCVAAVTPESGVSVTLVSVASVSNCFGRSAQLACALLPALLSVSQQR